MRRCRRAWTSLLLPLLSVLPAADARAGKISELLHQLGSDDVFERQLAEAELRRLEEDSLVSLSRAVTEFPSSMDRDTRFRASGLLSEMLQGVLTDFETEQLAYNLDLQSQKRLQSRKESAAALKELEPRLNELRAVDPDLDVKIRKLADLVELERFVADSQSAQAMGPPTPETAARLRAAAKAIEKLREERRAWTEADPELGAKMDPLVELFLKSQLGDGRELSQVEELHLEELAERVEERRPRVERLREQVWSIGLPALNEALIRRQTIRLALRPFYDELVSAGLGRFDATKVDGPEEFEVVRYSRGVLWAWEARRAEAGRSEGHPQGERSPARELLERHLEKVLQDLAAPAAPVRERAAEELFFLEEHGLRALERSSAATEASGEPAHGQDFLIELLRWRIRPSTYTRVGIHFGDFTELPFQKKRRKIFDYAKVAGQQAITTLQAIVMNDDLEASFLVKLAAAKALAGLRDLSGYEYLVTNHPELTMKKPEVSRELLIIQGYEYIQDKQYRLAVDELRKVLDEYPFDFRANYHIAFAYLLLKDYEKSIHHFEIARRINPKDQLTLYNLACAYSLFGKIDEALEALEASVEAGFTDYDHIEKDSDLDALRDQLRYRNLLRRLKSSAG